MVVNLDRHMQIMKLDGSEQRVAAPTVDTLGRADEVGFGDWSPDGKKLAFTEIIPTSGDAPPHGAVWIANADGSQARRVVACGTSCYLAYMAAWSPKGDQLAYAVADINPSTGAWTRSAIEVVNLSSGKRSVVTEVRGGLVEYILPRWSPDARRLVIQVSHWTSPTHDATAETALALVAVDGKRHTPTVIPSTDKAAHPDWHWADGTILFSTNDPDYTAGAVLAVAYSPSRLTART